MPSELKNKRNFAKADVKCQMLYTNLIELYCLKNLLFFPNLVQWIILDDFSFTAKRSEAVGEGQQLCDQQLSTGNHPLCATDCCRR